MLKSSHFISFHFISFHFPSSPSSSLFFVRGQEEGRGQGRRVPRGRRRGVPRPACCPQPRRHASHAAPGRPLPEPLTRCAARHWPLAAAAWRSSPRAAGTQHAGERKRQYPAAMAAPLPRPHDPAPSLRLPPTTRPQTRVHEESK